MNDRYLSCFVMSYLCQQNKIKISISRGTLLSLLKPRNAYLREFSLHAKTKTGLAFVWWPRLTLPLAATWLLNSKAKEKRREAQTQATPCFTILKILVFPVFSLFPLLLVAFYFLWSFSLKKEQNKEAPKPTTTSKYYYY